MTAVPRRLFGISAALTTPFDENGNVDNSALSKHASNLLQQGCASVTLGGTTGEGPSLSIDEKISAHIALTKARIAPEKIVFAVMETALPTAIAAARKALDLGSKYLLVAPPFYFKGTSERAVVDWFRHFLNAIADKPAKVILYNIPQMTAAPMTPDMVGVLLKAFPYVISGVKDSSGDWENTKALLEQFKELDILIGDERLLAPGIQLGGAGAISGVANFRPDLLIPLLDKHDPAPQLSAMVNLLLEYPVTAAVKSLVGHLTRNTDWRRIRAPLAPLDQAQYDILTSKYDGLFTNGTPND